MDGELENHIDHNQQNNLVQVELDPDKKHIKKIVGRISGGLLLYSIFMSVCLIITWTIIIFTTGLIEESEETIIEILLQSGSGYIISSILGTFLLAIFYRKLAYGKIFEGHKAMNGKMFFMLLSLVIGMQIMFQGVAYGLEIILNLFGYSYRQSIEEVSQMSTTLSHFIYVGLLGPVTEEIIFRGFIVGALKKYGKVFAICVSAILFGLLHGNLVQGIFAIGVGIIFAYVTVEYSIKWAMALHIANNFIFAELLTYLIKGMSEITQFIIQESIFGFFFMSAMIILVKNQHTIKDYIKKHEGVRIRSAFTSVMTIIYCIVTIGLAMSSIIKIV